LRTKEALHTAGTEVTLDNAAACIEGQHASGVHYQQIFNIAKYRSDDRDRSRIRRRQVTEDTAGRDADIAVTQHHQGIAEVHCAAHIEQTDIGRGDIEREIRW